MKGASNNDYEWHRAFESAARRCTREFGGRLKTARGNSGRFEGMAFLGFDRTAAVRFGAPVERRVFSTRWIYGTSRLRIRLFIHAPCERTNLDNADNSGFAGGTRKTAQEWRISSSSRSRRSHACGSACRRNLGAESPVGS